jgi:hypothetical protein
MTTTALPNYLYIVQSECTAGYSFPLGFAHATFLVNLATHIGAGAGLLRQEGSAIVRNGVPVAPDAICFPDGQVFKVLNDPNGAGDPTWQLVDHVDPRRYYDVRADTWGPAPVPTTPAPESAAVAALSATVAELVERVNQAERDAAEAKQDAARVGGQLATLRVKGPVDLPVTINVRDRRGRAKGDVDLPVTIP